MLRLNYHDWLGHWTLWLKSVAASFKRIAAFSNVQQHGEISIIHFTFILILFLPSLFWYYSSLFQCVYKLSTLFLYFCLLVILYVLSSCQYIHICCLRLNSSGCAFWTYCLVRSFREISTYKIIFSKVSDLYKHSLFYWSQYQISRLGTFCDP